MENGTVGFYKGARAYTTRFRERHNKVDIVDSDGNQLGIADVGMGYDHFTPDTYLAKTMVESAPVRELVERRPGRYVLTFVAISAATSAVVSAVVSFLFR